MYRSNRLAFMRSENWVSLGFKSWTLAVEASAVIALRLAKFAAWDTRSHREAQLMVSEKITVALELQWLAVTGELGQTPYSATTACLAHYRKAVAVNRRRLSSFRG